MVKRSFSEECGTIFEDQDEWSNEKKGNARKWWLSSITTIQKERKSAKKLQR